MLNIKNQLSTSDTATALPSIKVSVSIIEIYRNEIFDLLDNSQIIDKSAVLLEINNLKSALELIENAIKKKKARWNRSKFSFIKINCHYPFILG